MTLPDPLPAPRGPVFDRLAAVYDPTRGPLDPTTATALIDLLRAHGVADLLEIGIGTGRVAAPLQQAGFRVSGADRSTAMLQPARAKGIPRLIRAEATQLPLRPNTFDAVLMAHFLHLVKDPGLVLREAQRVSRGPVLGLVTVVPGIARLPETPQGRLRARFRSLLREEGASIPDSPSPADLEARLLERFPPRELTLLSDRIVEDSAERVLRVLELRGYRELLDLPEAPFARALQRLRTESAGERFSTRRTYSAASWSK